MWLAVIGLWLLIAVVLASIPVIGKPLDSLLYPVFFAGLMSGCKAVEEGRELELSYLFAGFRANTRHLVTVGGVNLVGQIVIAAAMLAVGADTLATIEAGNGLDPSKTIDAIEALTPMILTGAALSLPLLMALWFAPALVTFHDLSGVEALRASFRACLVNVMPFLLYGVITFAMLLLIPATVGLAIIILIPTLVATIYTGYKDIFVTKT
jgi:hypothetical protein